MIPSTSTLQAMAGRFLAGRELVAWEDDSRQRCVELVRAFQHKLIDPVALEAALASERTASTVPATATGVALIELLGVLTPNESIFSLLGFGTSVRTFMRQLAAAHANPAVKSIVIACDSPGGSIRLVPEASSLMRTVRSRKPIITATTGLNASAAFWITANSSAIASTPSGLIGSVGVCCERPSIARLLDKQGVDVEVITSARYKSEGNVALPLTDAERRHLKLEVDAAHRDFVTAVAAGRGTTSARVDAEFGEGRLVRADDALRRNMIDAVELTESTFARALSAPAELTALREQRADRLRAAATAESTQQSRAEIAAYRQRFAAGRGGRAAPSV